ncbi:HYR domain-containing protein [Tenacibaculum ovolyticum]|uniref:HYR-like domain-containing protein n=1 Tax=Tenacibaculum ovolyticum TaxID=104270 RepID=UPI0022F38305|nr:HYR domain-containing protein [Tenacibaculum ovolyticum]WBX77665.1 HYR domain-containing protein [Tenacibaculum ovolyticum]
MKNNSVIRSESKFNKIACLLLLFFNVFVSFGQGNPKLPISGTDDTQRFSVYGEQIADDLGKSVSNLGDVNGDGIDDIITGAPGINDGIISDVGEAYIIFGATGITTASVDVNNLTGLNGFTVRGVNASDEIGIAVSSAGDINDDGINDVLIGSSGKAIIIFGNTTGFLPLYTITDINGVNGIILEDTLLGGKFGETLSNIPDVNNDGIDDVIIGSPNNIGNAYVFYGGSTIGNTDAASLNGSNGFKIEGFSQSSSGSELNVSNAGDINNDGIEDVILGYPSYDEGSERYAGRVVVVFGSSIGFSSVFSLSSLNGINGFIINEDIEYARLGNNVKSGKDFNGDGIDDLAITSANKAYVVFGKTTLFSPLIKISDILITDKFVFNAGWFRSIDRISGIDGLSDVNNDGITDLIISSPHWTGYAKSGSVYVLYGNTSLPATMGSMNINGVNGYHIFDDVRYSYKGFGASVSNAGDFNNDGTNDFIVGEIINLSHTYNKIGATHVFFGNTFVDIIDNIAPIINCPSGPQELYANSVLPNYINFLSSVSDNSSYNTDMQYTQTPSEGTLITSNTNVEITVTDESGNTSSCSFMVTLKTTTAEIDCATTNFSVNNLNGTNGIVIYGEDPHSETGYDVNTAGDVNGDGIDDFIVVAKGDTVNFTGPYSAYHIDVRGGVYIIFGTSSGFPPNIDLEYLNGINGFKINNDNLPHSNTSSDIQFFKADTAGDINNDGFDDIILSNPNSRSSSGSNRVGNVYVVFGKNSGFSADFDLATLNGTNGFTISGTGTNAYFGNDLDNLGDVNGDGLDDIIVTNGTYSGHAESGKCFVIYGSASGYPALFDLSGLDGTNGFKITSDGSTAENIGNSVAGIGDVNGDNINDIAIGGAKDRKFIVFGKPSGATFPSTFNVEDLNGSNGFAVEHSTSTLGQSVEKANDVNNDGFTDVIFGKKYVLFGGNTFPAVFDLESLDGTNGFSVSSTGKVFSFAGDFNNDNYDDLIFGDYSSQYLIYGRENWEESISISSSAPGCLLKITLFNSNDLASGSYAGDVNNDGIDDLILGHYHQYNYNYKVNSDPGFAYVIFGKDMPDTEAPVLNCPANQILASGELLPDYTPLGTVTDNCDSCIVITQAPIAGSVYTPGMTITLTATDKKGNSANCDFIVTDNTDIIDPTATNPLPINVQCLDDVPLPNPLVVTDEADNSGTPPTVVFVSDVNISASVITRTYSVTDGAGNSINVTQTINISDTIKPTASDPLPINVSCIGDVPAEDITVVTDEADNCTGTITVAFVSDVSDGNSNPEIITRTYSVTDEALNSINVTQTITVNDIVKPTASDPLPINVSCIGDVPSADITVVTDEADNCTGTITVAFVSDVSDGNSNPEIITRTYSVTDEALNSINVTQTITVNDIIKPTASDPLPINVSCAGDIPSADITVVTDESDNCTGTITVAFVSDVSDGNSNPEIITRTYSVTDEALNSINVTQTITVNDIIKPTASDPLPINVSCAGDIPSADITVVTDEADNCTGTITVAFVSDVSDGNSNPEIITRTYSVTDEALNSINVTQTITVNDIIKPTASDPLPINVSCAGDIPSVDITVVTDEADNCTGAIIVAFVNDVNTSPGIITRTYSVTDVAGNTINVTQTINISDIVKPTANNPLPINVSCIGDVPIADITVVTDEADNCTGAITVAFVSDVNTSSSVTTRTYSVTDAAGNSINVTQIINISDTINPTASNPTAINVSCIGDVPAADITVVTDEADNCTGAIIVAFVSDVNTSSSVTTRTYSVTDAAGNSINVTQIINISDTIKPTASDPLPINISCIGDVPIADINVVTDEVDNCTGIVTVAFVSDVNTSPSVITRTYSVTDVAGNSINVTQTITVSDAISPTATNPLPINVLCIGDVPSADITVVTDEADNCTGVITVAFVNDVNTSPGIITRTYSVTDTAGNSTDVTQTITVSDTIAPTATNPAGVIVSCVGDIPAADITIVADEADNCTGVITVAFVGDISDGNSNPEIITRTYSVTDAVGNFTNVTQTIIVNDNTAPVITCPSNSTQKVDSGLLTAVVTFTNPVATDNCTAVTINQTAGLPSGAEFSIGINTISFEAIDTAGNTATCSFTITIEAEDPLVCTVDAGTDFDITEGDEVTLNAVISGAGIIEWSPSVGLSSTTIANPIASPTETTTYTIRFVNTEGCVAEDTITVFVTLLEKDETKYGFSPDGDGINEYWEIDGIENYPNNQVLIYNRWGDLIFETTGYNNASNVFRGIANKKRNLGAGKLPEGTYLFHIKIKGSHNLKKEKGFLILKR